MAALGTLRRLGGRFLRQLARRNTSDIVALDLSTLDAAPDLRGWELTVVSAGLGPAKARSLIEGALPRRLHEEFITTVARGGLLYMLFGNGRMEHYNWVGMTELHQAHFVAGRGDAVSWNSWTIQEARGSGLFGLSLNLMGWHLKQQGYHRIFGAVETWNTPSVKGRRRAGLECVGRYTLWTLFGCVFFRIEHAARGLRRYRFFFGLRRRKAPRLRHPATLPEPEPSTP
ncbi:MAG: hypothetical protein ACYS0K_04650 [Planctomycetota bacterium]|jgi:hypothetical protein